MSTLTEARPYTEFEVTMMVCHAVMKAWDFDYQRRKSWFIWASKHRVCPTCLSPEHLPCLNMSDIKRGAPEPKVNKVPHDDRVDWHRLLEGLKQRGLYRPVIENQVRKRVKIK